MPPPDKNRFAKNPLSVCSSLPFRNRCYLTIVVIQALCSIIRVTHHANRLKLDKLGVLGDGEGGATVECRTCRRQLEEGVDVVEVQDGIIGAVGFVALDEKILLCSFVCVRNYLDGSKEHVLKRRIP